MARSKGLGTIRKRSDGLYEGRITRDKITKYFYSRDKRSVEKQMLEYSMNGSFEKVVKIRFKDYVNTYLLTYKYGHVKASTYDRLERTYNNYIVDSEIGTLPLSELTDIKVQQYINGLPELNISYSMAKKIYDMVRVVLIYAYVKKDIAVDIANIMKMPIKESFKEVRHIETYTHEEYEILYDYIMTEYSVKKNQRSLRYAPLYLILFHTGLRVGELLALTWKDIDFRKNIIHVSKSVSFVRNRTGEGNTKNISIITSVKTSAGVRDIPVNRTCIELFKELGNRYSDFDCSSEYVCCNLDGSFIKLRAFERQFQRICKRADVQYKGIHAIRHTFASNLIEKGVFPKVVSELLGHTNVVFTLNRYVHTDNNAKKEAVDLL